MNENSPDQGTNLDAAIQKFSEEMHIPADTYKQILISSLGPTKEDLDNLETAINASDFENIQLISHRLKGTYSNLRLDNLTAPATEMNDLSKKAEGIDQIKDLFSQFQNVFAQISEYLGQ